jgi:hypothetical protein
VKLKPAKMRVTLSSAGNPDHGQYFGENVLSPTLLVEVKDFAEASAVCRAYITQHNLGAGNWAGGTIHQGKRVVAKLSYNGRIWPA